MPPAGFDFDRFLEAQAAVYEQVLTELRAGQKRSHWMWFIFPQLRGLGSSPMSERYAIASIAEAAAYARHALLGPRLVECTELVIAAARRCLYSAGSSAASPRAPRVDGRGAQPGCDARSEGHPASAIFGIPDDLKFRSSMTLFHEAARDESTFTRALAECCGGHCDPRTLALLQQHPARADS
ncbi:MAG: DUF1810 domain-containing protein [Terriglobales bacterium]